MTKPWTSYWGPCRFCEPAATVPVPGDGGEDALEVALVGDDPGLPPSLEPLSYIELAVQTAGDLLRGERQSVDEDTSAAWEAIAAAEYACKTIRAVLGERIRARLSSVGASADTERVASALFEVRRRAALVGKRMNMALDPDCERTEQVSAVMQAVEQYRAALSQEARP